jgi:4-hydroxybenzoate polyprenyltransferase
MREYSLRIKTLGLPGNLMVAALASMPFVYGAWAVDDPWAGVVLAVVAAPLHLARELAKDLDDVEGDAIARRTLAVQSVVGAKRALVVSMVMFVAAVAAFALPRPAAAVALLPATAVASLGAWRAMRDRRGGPILFKSAMVLAMLSLFTLDATRIR